MNKFHLFVIWACFSLGKPSHIQHHQSRKLDFIDAGVGGLKSNVKHSDSGALRNNQNVTQEPDRRLIEKTSSKIVTQSKRNNETTLPLPPAFSTVPKKEGETVPASISAVPKKEGETVMTLAESEPIPPASFSAIPKKEGETVMTLAESDPIPPASFSAIPKKEGETVMTLADDKIDPSLFKNKTYSENKNFKNQSIESKDNTSMEEPKEDTESVSSVLLLVPEEAEVGDVIEFKVEGASGKFQASLPVGVVPGKSRIQAQIPPTVKVKKGAKVIVVDIKRASLQQHHSTSSLTRPNELISNTSRNTNPLNDGATSSSFQINEDKNQPNIVSGIDEDESPTKGIAVGVRASLPISSVPRAPIPQATEALLSQSKSGHRFASPKGRMLLVSPATARHGPGNIFGNIFDLNDNFLYVGEPCGPSWVSARLKEYSESGHTKPPRSDALTDKCGQLIARFLACSPSVEDVIELVAPSYYSARNPKKSPPNSGAGRLLTQHLGPLVFDLLNPITATELQRGKNQSSTDQSGNGISDAESVDVQEEEQPEEVLRVLRQPKEAVDVFVGLCQRRIVVVHERFFGLAAPNQGTTSVVGLSSGEVKLPPSLLAADANLPILLGVKDPRSAVPGSLTPYLLEQALCGYSRGTQACAELICGALVNIHTGMVSRLYGGGGDAKQTSKSENAVAQYLIVKYEDLIEEPRVLAARIVQWAGVTLTSVSTAVSRRFDDYLRRSIDEGEEQAKSRLLSTTEAASGVEELKACRTAVVTLAYQTAAMNRDKSRSVVIAPKKKGNQYPAEIVDEFWTAVCDLQSRVVRDTRGFGGMTPNCQCPGKIPLAECRWRLRTQSSCSAMTYTKDGKCCLHDRSSDDFSVGREDGARHTVKMLAGVDACMSLPSDKFVSLQTRITNMMKKHSLHARSSLATSGKLFYMYDGPTFKWRDIITCYRHENGRVAPWEDERWPELAQNTGQLWVHEALTTHPRRTHDPNKADLFIVPVESYVSGKLKYQCRGTDHQTRMRRVAKAVATSEHFLKNGGKDHLVVCAWWGAWRAWEQGNPNKEESLWELMRKNSILATYDEFFARDWNKVVMVPYVPHALLTQQFGLKASNGQQLLSSTAGQPITRAPRKISFYFRGGVLHGVDCKKNHTWVRKAAYDTFRTIKGAKFEPTENIKLITNNDGSIADWVNEKTRHSKIMKTSGLGNFKVGEYAAELQQSIYCLHFRGDTTTSRRVYDAIAAGCVPIIISDGTNLPFHSSVDWSTFSVQISEATLLKGPDHARPIFEELLRDTRSLRDRQHALMLARHDLLYGIGSPLNASRAFVSRVTDHILEEAMELTDINGRFRQFPDTFGECAEIKHVGPGVAPGTTAEDASLEPNEKAGNGDATNSNVGGGGFSKPKLKKALGTGW